MHCRAANRSETDMPVCCDHAGRSVIRHDAQLPCRKRGRTTSHGPCEQGSGNCPPLDGASWLAFLQEGRLFPVRFELKIMPSCLFHLAPSDTRRIEILLSMHCEIDSLGANNDVRSDKVQKWAPQKRRSANSVILLG
jgi:hypothetical protein